MHESGYAEDLNTTEEETSVITVSVEPVECPTEKDGSLLLSTLQTQLPGAAGLWFPIDGPIRKRAIRFDGSTEKFLPPPNGWGAHEQFFVSYCYASPYRPCLSGLSTYDQYQSATEKFQTSISAVQKLFDLDASTPTDQRAEVETLFASKNVPALEAALTPECNGDAGVEEKALLISALQQKLIDKDALIVGLEKKLSSVQTQLVDRIPSSGEEDVDKLIEQNEYLNKELSNLRDQFDGTRQRLNDIDRETSEKVQSLENQLGEVTQQRNDAQWRVGELEGQSGQSGDGTETLRQELAQAQQNLNDTKWRCGELEAEIGQKHDELNHLQNEMETRVNELEAQKEDLIHGISSPETNVEYMHSLRMLATEHGESEQEVIDRIHRIQHDLDNANQTVVSLRHVVENEKDPEINNLKDRINQLESEFGQAVQNYNDAKWRIGELETQSGQTHESIPGLNERISQLEQELSQAQQNFNDTKWRCGELEAEIGQKHDELNHLRNEMETRVNELEAQKEDLIHGISSPETNVEYMHSLRMLAAEHGESEQEVIDRIHRIQHDLDNANQTVVSLRHVVENEKDPEINNLKDRINQLESEFGQAVQNYNDAKWRIGELETQSGQTHESIPGLNERISQLEQELSQAQQNFNDTKWRCGELESEIGQKHDELNHLRNEMETRVNELEVEKEDLIHGISSPVTNVEYMHSLRMLAAEHGESEQEVIDRIHGIQHDLDNANQTVVSLRHVVENEKDPEINNLKDRINQLESELGQAVQNYNDTKWRIGELEAQSGQTHESIPGLNERISQLEQELSQAHQNSNDAKWRVGELEGEINQVRDQRNGVCSELANVKEMTENLQSVINNEKDPEINALKDRINHLEHELGQAIQNVNDSKWRVGELEAQLGQRMEPIQVVEEQIQECSFSQQEAQPGMGSQEKLNQLEQEVSEANKKYNDAKWRVGELETEVGQLKDQLNVLHNELTRTNKTAESLQSMVDPEINNLLDRISQLETELGQAVQNFQDAKWRVGELEAQVGQSSGSEERIRQLEGELSQERHNYNNANGRIGELQAEIGQLRDQLNGVKNELETRISQIEAEKEEIIRGASSPVTNVEYLNSLRSLAKGDEHPVAEPEEEIVLEKVRKLQEIVTNAAQKAESIQAVIDNEKDPEIQALKDRINQLESELGQAIQNYNDTKWKVGELEAQSAHVHEGSSGPNERITQLEQELSQAHQNYNDAKWRVGELEAEVEQMKEQLIVKDVLEVRVKELEVEKEDLIRGISSPVTNVEYMHSLRMLAAEHGESEQEVIDRVHRIQHDMDNTKHKVEHLQSVIEKEKDPEINNLKTRIAQLETELQQTVQDCNDAKWRVGELEAQRTEGSPEKIGQLEEVQTEMYKKYNESKWRVGELEAEVEQLKDQLNVIHNDFVNTNQTTDGLQSVIQSEKDRNQTLIGEITQLQDRINQLEGQLGEAVQNFNDAKWRVGELDAVVAQKDGEIGDLKGKMDHYEKEQGSEVQISDDIKLRLKELETALEQKDSEVISLKTELQVKVTELDTTAIELANRVEEVCVRQVAVEQETTQQSVPTDTQLNMEHVLLTIKGQLGEAEHEAHAVTQFLQNRVTHLQEDLTHKDQEWAALLRAAETQIGVKDNELETLRERVKELSQGKAQTETADYDLVRNLQQQLEEANRSYSEAEQAANDRRNQLESEIGDLRRQFDELKWRCGELEAGVHGHEIYDKLKHLEWELNETRQQMNDARWRCGELESECGRKDGELNELRNQLNYANNKLRELEQQVSRTPERRRSIHDDHAVTEMSTELQTAVSFRYDLESQINNLKNDLHGTQQHCQHLGGELKRHQDELWVACERKSQLEHNCGCLEAERNDLLHRLNDCEDRIKWLESELHNTHEQYEKAQIDNKRRDLEKHVTDAFLIRKEPFVDRQKWMLTMLDEYMDVRDHHGGATGDGFIRTWFEIDAPNAATVYMIGSFTNWECALMCTMHPHGKWGVWVDVPRGRYEFRFIVDGDWWTSDQYEKNWNDYGTMNNNRYVE